MFEGIFGNKAEMPEEEEEVVTHEKVELPSELPNEKVELSLVEDEVVEGGDPYNTADKIITEPDDLLNEKSANEALAEEADRRKAA